MATENNTSNTHITDLKGRIRIEISDPTNPQAGDMYFDPNQNYLKYYDGSAWIGARFV